MKHGKITSFDPRVSDLKMRKLRASDPTVNFDQIREIVEQARNRSEGSVTLPTEALAQVLPDEPDACIHAILVKHGVVLREDIVRDIALFLFGPHKPS